jgi:hypothetical protein
VPLVDRELSKNGFVSEMECAIVDIRDISGGQIPGPHSLSAENRILWNCDPCDE